MTRGMIFITTGMFFYWFRARRPLPGPALRFFVFVIWICFNSSRADIIATKLLSWLFDRKKGQGQVAKANKDAGGKALDVDFDTKARMISDSQAEK